MLFGQEIAFFEKEIGKYLHISFLICIFAANYIFIVRDMIRLVLKKLYIC